jgi:hypothetical protein
MSPIPLPFASTSLIRVLGAQKRGSFAERFTGIQTVPNFYHKTVFIGKLCFVFSFCSECHKVRDVSCDCVCLIAPTHLNSLADRNIKSCHSLCILLLHGDSTKFWKSWAVPSAVQWRAVIFFKYATYVTFTKKLRADQIREILVTFCSRYFVLRSPL